MKSVFKFYNNMDVRTLVYQEKGTSRAVKFTEKNGIEKEEVKLEKKQTFHDKFVKDLQDNTPHAGQFNEDI